MSHKTLAKIAVVMILVFGLTVVLYPMLFNPDDKAKAAVEVPVAPAGAPIAPAGH